MYHDVSPWTRKGNVIVVARQRDAKKGEKKGRGGRGRVDEEEVLSDRRRVREQGTRKGWGGGQSASVCT